MNNAAQWVVIEELLASAHTPRRAGWAVWIAYDLPGSTSQEELLSIIDKLNADEGVDGILVQLPLPAHLDTQAILDRLEEVERRIGAPTA